MGASDENIAFLTTVIGDPDGRQKWLEYKLQRPMMDLRGADMKGRDLRDFDFSDTNFSGANFSSADLTGADFSDADLAEADFRRATMCNCCMDRAELRGANFQGATLSDACIEEANLTEARLQGADLVGADLAQSNLTQADLRAACLKYTRMTGAILTDANVAEADLTGSVMDDEAPGQMRNFDLAIVDDRKFRMMRSRSKGATPPPKFARGWAKDDTARQMETADSSPGTQRSAGTKRSDFSPPPVTPRKASDDTQDDTGSARDLFGKEDPPTRAKVTPSQPANGATSQPQPPPPPPLQEAKTQPPPEPKVESAPTAEPSQTGPSESKSQDEGFSGESTTRRMAREYQGANFAFGAKAEAQRAKQAKEDSLRQEQERNREDLRKKLFGSYVAKKLDLESDEGCWRVLGVKSNPAFAEIQKAYRNKCKIFHPDKVNHLEKKDQDFAREQFHLVKQAFEILARRRDSASDNIVWVEGVVKRKSPYEQTLGELIKLVEANPGHEALLYNLAYKYAESNNIEMAIRTYDRVLIVNPNNEDALHNLKVLKLKKSFGLSGKA